jgi:hypothetical protein
MFEGCNHHVLHYNVCTFVISFMSALQHFFEIFCHVHRSVAFGATECNNGATECNNGATECNNGATECNNGATECNNANQMPPTAQKRSQTRM